MRKESKLIIFGCTLYLLSGCVSPNVWVQSRTSNGGVIGYQNYDPKSDNGKRIQNLIPCANHKMVWNGMKSQVTGAPTYYFSGGMAVPVDSGVVQWVEYQYECISETSSSSIYTSASISDSPPVSLEKTESCRQKCADLWMKNKLDRGESVIVCREKCEKNN